MCGILSWWNTDEDEKTATEGTETNQPSGDNK
jgi:hypothetical protein